MANNIDITHLSLIILSVLIISSLSLLVSKTLKEGRNALKEITKIKINNSKEI